MDRKIANKQIKKNQFVVNVEQPQQQQQQIFNSIQFCFISKEKKTNEFSNFKLKMVAVVVVVAVVAVVVVVLMV